MHDGGGGGRGDHLGPFEPNRWKTFIVCEIIITESCPCVQR
jgi:hypothetical protein